jgi:hypothetical protein
MMKKLTAKERAVAWAWVEAAIFAGGDPEFLDYHQYKPHAENGLRLVCKLRRKAEKRALREEREAGS